jgi:hypothetical protein
MNDLSDVVNAMYESVCFEAGERPDWSRNEEIFARDARMVRITDGGVFEFDNHTYRENLEAMIDSDALACFWEAELWRETRQFGEMAHVLSAYESRAGREGAFLGRGVNSIQLYRREGCWLISAMVWRREGRDVRIADTPPA